MGEDSSLSLEDISEAYGASWLPDIQKTCFSWLVQAPGDEWEKYMLVYMAAIREKFYPAPKQAACKMTQAARLYEQLQQEDAVVGQAA